MIRCDNVTLCCLFSSLLISYTYTLPPPPEKKTKIFKSLAETTSTRLLVALIKDCELINSLTECFIELYQFNLSLMCMSNWL